MAVTTTTDNIGLIKYWRGHPVRDTDIAANMDIIDAAFQGGLKVAKGALAFGDADDFAFAWQNPEATAILVQCVIVDVTTVSATANSVLDVGVASSATGTDDTILDGVALTADAVSTSTNVSDSGTNGNEKVHRVDANGGTNDYITGKILVANAAALVGKYYIEYVVV